MSNIEKYGFCPFSNQMKKEDCGIYAFCDSCNTFIDGYEKGKEDERKEMLIHIQMTLKMIGDCADNPDYAFDLDNYKLVYKAFSWAFEPFDDQETHKEQDMQKTIRREPTTEEIALMRLNNMRPEEYMVLDNETDSNQLVCIHRRKSRRRTIEKRK